MPWRSDVSGIRWQPQTLRAGAAGIGAILALAGCQGSSAAPSGDGGPGPAEVEASSVVTDCEKSAEAGFACAWDAGCYCIDLAQLPPIAVIRFQVQPPQSDTDYPYGQGNLPAQGPGPSLPVYLSALGSSDPQGIALGFYWDVQDPTGAYVAITPAANVEQVSFVPTLAGTYRISLEVIEQAGFRQSTLASLDLNVVPIPCAPDGVSPPCSDELPVPGGTFLMGSLPDAGNDDEHPQHSVTLAPFLLDKYEVTVGRFRQFLGVYDGGAPADGAGANPLVPGSGWSSTWDQMNVPQTSALFMSELSQCGGTWTDTPGPGDAVPLTCLSWYTAFQFCIWDGKRLPSEEEWEYAAAGGSEQRTYPWGEADPTSQLAVYGCLFSLGDAPCQLPVVGSAPMGAAKWGHLDLAGSVWEWTLDMYATYTTDPCDNCANLTQGMGRVFRGGDYTSDPSELRVTSRLAFNAIDPDPTRGFRCAQSPADAGTILVDGGESGSDDASLDGQASPEGATAGGDAAATSAGEGGPSLGADAAADAGPDVGAGGNTDATL